MKRIKCYTSFSFSYLSRAILFARTLRQAHPDWEIWALIVDVPPQGTAATLPLTDFDRVVYPEQLGFEHFHAWLFKHDVVEACTAVKGRMMAHLLQTDADHVVYFDPDIAVFHPLDSVLSSLGDHSIVLTPHQVTPNLSPGQIRDNEQTSLTHGTYNLGFCAVNRDDVGMSFSEWWSTVLAYACYDDIGNGFFTDQKWCDLVPALFPRVWIERDPGCNVASWNLSARRIAFTVEGGIEVNGSPLKFYHYTKINSAGDLMTEKYAGENVEVMEIWNWYKRAIRQIAITGIPSGYWHYGTFDNGQRIPKAARVLYRHREDLRAAFPNPYTTAGDSYHSWLLREHPDILLTPTGGGFEAV